MSTRSIVAEVRMIPNQPLKFAGDQQGRSEDDLIALTWARFIQGGDESWPAQLPMTKAVVRAMDTVASLCASEQGGRITLDGFVLVGASKRGWTAWAASSVDRRVIAVVPIVIDMLNIEPSFANHLAAYGYFSPAVRDYEGQGILNWRGTPRYAELMRVLDPYSFRSRVTIPKLLINAAGDQFFLPDSWQFYYHDLPGEKQLRYIPNADHGMAGTDVWMSVSLAYNAFISNTKLPRFDWRVDRDGTIRVVAQDRPSAVKLWQITNPGSRDFRLSTIGARWTSSDLQEQGSGTWSAKVGAPPRGWTAYMIELTYPSAPMLPPHKFTTGIKVVPESLPFAEVIKPPAR
jgi:PhoPQ-activated pathogenicity-related protein